MQQPNSIAVDPRIISPLVCNPDDRLTRWPVDTLHRVSITLELLADLIGDSSEGAWFQSPNSRFALSLQLSGMADLLAALSEAMSTKRGTP